MFVILSLPRSRTAWLSAFLSYKKKRCGHDLAAVSGSITEFMNALARVDGTCETGAVLGWKLIKRFIPHAQIIVIKRPLDQIERSLARFGITAVEGELEERRAMLDECGDSPGVTEIDFEQLDDPAVCKWIFETCLKLPFDEAWYQKMAKQNIQVDVRRQIANLAARQDVMTRFKGDVARMVQQVEGRA